MFFFFEIMNVIATYQCSCLEWLVIERNVTSGHRLNLSVTCHWILWRLIAVHACVSNCACCLCSCVVVPRHRPAGGASSRSSFARSNTRQAAASANTGLCHQCKSAMFTSEDWVVSERIVVVLHCVCFLPLHVHHIGLTVMQKDVRHFISV